MRLLILSASYPSKENLTTAMFIHVRAKMYQRHGNNVFVFVPSNEAHQYLFEGIHVCKGNIHFFHALLKLLQPHIVAIHTPYYLALRKHVAFLEKQRFPFILWIHGCEALLNFFHHYTAPFEMKQKLRYLLTDPIKILALRHLMMKAHAIVYASEWMQTFTERYAFFHHANSHVIPNPIDTDLFQFKQKADISRGLTVRNLGWKYGLDIAIRAYSHCDYTELTILGTGELEEYLYDLARKCESNVWFMAYRINHEAMVKLYHQFGYFVAPSRTEGQGVAMCEAMSSGLPVIATAVGGIPEFIVNEVNGLLVPPENPLALRKAIQRLLSNERLYDRLASVGSYLVKRHLSSHAIYPQEEALFHELCRVH